MIEIRHEQKAVFMHSDGTVTPTWSGIDNCIGGQVTYWAPMTYFEVKK